MTQAQSPNADVIDQSVISTIIDGHVINWQPIGWLTAPMVDHAKIKQLQKHAGNFTQLHELKMKMLYRINV